MSRSYVGYEHLKQLDPVEGMPKKKNEKQGEKDVEVKILQTELTWKLKRGQ